MPKAAWGRSPAFVLRSPALPELDSRLLWLCEVRATPPAPAGLLLGSAAAAAATTLHAARMPTPLPSGPLRRLVVQSFTWRVRWSHTGACAHEAPPQAGKKVGDGSGVAGGMGSKKREPETDSSTVVTRSSEAKQAHESTKQAAASAAAAPGRRFVAGRAGKMPGGRSWFRRRRGQQVGRHQPSCLGMAWAWGHPAGSPAAAAAPPPPPPPPPRAQPPPPDPEHPAARRAPAVVEGGGRTAGRMRLGRNRQSTPAGSQGTGQRASRAGACSNGSATAAA